MPQTPLNYVYLLQGSDSEHDFSNGNTYPSVTMPWGMTAWSIQTQESQWFFSYRNKTFRGIRATHQPSPWMRDYAPLVFTPLVGDWCDHPALPVYPYDVEDQQLAPHHMRVTLPSIRTTMQLVPTQRCAMMQLDLPSDERCTIKLRTLPGQTTFAFDAKNNRLLGTTAHHSGAAPGNFKMYFVIQCSQAISTTQWLDANGQPISTDSECNGDALSAVMQLATLPNEPVTLSIGMSFISHEQAMQNMKQELASYSLDELREQGTARWNELLSRIEIQSDDLKQKQTFYSCLYRCLLYPRAIDEVNTQGKLIHYSPFDGQIHDGPMYTDNGFWDTYRTLYPLLTVLCPSRLSLMLQGWLNAYREGGWLPKWASPGYHNCMVGTHAASVLADAAVKDIADVDWELALEAMLKDATQTGDSTGGRGRLGVDHYIKQGYVASDQTDHAVARTLDFAYNDHCIAQLAAKLGKTDIENQYRKQAQNYQHLYDSNVGFMRAKNSNGQWVEPFREFAWTRDYIEGGPWQASWAVPHDPQGLIELMGGHDAVIEKLQQMMTMQPIFEQGDYPREIHEMTEMAMANLGQYAQSNQPVHHVLEFFTEAGQPDLASQWITKVLTEHYHATPDGFPGDEDNGEMSAWYVLHALGLFAMCPGNPTYHLNVPLFPKAEIHLENGAKWTITRDGDVEKCQSITVNAQPCDRWKIDHTTLMQGGHMHAKA
ncbi:MAG: GH92 family glycosyl hydrolase [Phycisphaeraceae bacterium JB051]